MIDLGGAQSYIPSFDVLFSQHNIKRILEFGEGNGTAYFLDNVDFVCSIEVVANDNHRSWASKCKEMYGQNKKWKQIVYLCSNNLKLVDNSCQLGIQVLANQYLHELQSILQMGMMTKPYDLVFVDYGIHLRGDMVNLLMEQNIPIIVAHDTNIAPEKYGWNRIVQDSKYKKFSNIQDYCGTTFWVKSYNEN